MNKALSPTPMRQRLRALLPTLAVLAVAAVIVAYMLGSSSEAQRVRPARNARLVEVTTLDPAAHPLRLEAWGTVQAARRITLQPQVAGEIQATGAGFEPGALVHKGDLLVKIDPRDYELAVRQRRAELTRARAELAQEQGRRAVAEQEFKLLQGNVTAAQRRLMLREPQLETAKAAVAAAEAALATAELALARTEVRAPFNALVLDQGVNVGTRVTTGSTLATLAGTDAYWVELAVPSASLKWLDVPDAGVRLYHEQVWGPDRFREGSVIRLRGDLDEKGRMARLLVEVPDPLALEDGSSVPRLLLGAFLRAEIEGQPVDDSLALQRAWLRDGDTLWLMGSDGRLAIRPVEVVYRGTEEVFVHAEIRDGERIVTSDLSIPAEGMPLRAVGDPPAGGDREPRPAS